MGKLSSFLICPYCAGLASGPVIATASRLETIEWVQKMGADHVINHRESLVDQVAEQGLAPQYVAALTGTDVHFPANVEHIKTAFQQWEQKTNVF